MVIREWRARALPSKADGYSRHFRDDVLPQLRKTPGFVGASVSQRLVNDSVEFLVLTQWSSTEAIRNFAGDNISRAVVEPAATEILYDYDQSVQHYEIVEEIRNAP